MNDIEDRTAPSIPSFHFDTEVRANADITCNVDLCSSTDGIPLGILRNSGGSVETDVVTLFQTGALTATTQVPCISEAPPNIIPPPMPRPVRSWGDSLASSSSSPTSILGPTLREEREAEWASATFLDSFNGQWDWLGPSQIEPLAIAGYRNILAVEQQWKDQVAEVARRRKQKGKAQGKGKERNSAASATPTSQIRSSSSTSFGTPALKTKTACWCSLHSQCRATTDWKDERVVSRDVSLEEACRLMQLYGVLSCKNKTKGEITLTLGTKDIGPPSLELMDRLLRQGPRIFSGHYVCDCGRRHEKSMDWDRHVRETHGVAADVSVASATEDLPGRPTTQIGSSNSTSSGVLLAPMPLLPVEPVSKMKTGCWCTLHTQATQAGALRPTEVLVEKGVGSCVISLEEACGLMQLYGVLSCKSKAKGEIILTLDSSKDVGPPWLKLMDRLIEQGPRKLNGHFVCDCGRRYMKSSNWYRHVRHFHGFGKT